MEHNDAGNGGEGNGMVDVALGRIVIREDADPQFIYLREREGERGFSIVIGSTEAGEIHRVVNGVATERPLTHQLTFAAIQALGARLRSVDIVDLRHNTYFAQVLLEGADGDVRAVVDARPSDAIALALRARCPIRVSEDVLRMASSEPEDEAEDEDETGDDPA